MYALVEYLHICMYVAVVQSLRQQIMHQSAPNGPLPFYFGELSPYLSTDHAALKRRFILLESENS